MDINRYGRALENDKNVPKGPLGYFCQIPLE